MRILSFSSSGIGNFLKSIRRTIPSFCALLVLAAPVTIQAQFTYTTNADGSTITITGYTGSGGAMNIPASTNGFTVTGIQQHAFINNYSLTSVTIPGSITNIGDAVFYSCRNLTNATISNGVTSIGGDMFNECLSLTSVSIPDSVTNIGNGAFDDCPLTSAVIPGSVTSIGESAFAGCDLLTNDMIANGVTSIEAQAFEDCHSLKCVELPNTLTNIGYAAFANCYVLGNVTIPSSVIGPGDLAFAADDSLTNATFAKGATGIAHGMFAACPNLTGVFFSGNAPALDGYAGDGPVFSYDTNVTVYYLIGTTGWSNTYQGVPAVLWNPQIQTSDGYFGVRSNQFGFNITCTNSIPIVIEACTNLANPVWTPLTNVSLTNGSFYFSDPQWTNYPGRFYGIGFP
jgi:hypothetical protein